MHPIYSQLHAIVNDAHLDNVSQMTVKVMLKEYLQNYILDAIYSNQNTQDLIFYGGTALRKIYGLDRMSEDLDFESIKIIDLEKTAEGVLLYFKRQKFDHVEYKIQQGKIISRITFKFEVLHDLGLSPNSSEKLHVKVEINPQPKSKNLKTQLTPFMKDQMSIMIKHYSLSVMMTGKVNACLSRVFAKGDSGIKVKGRDYYDLIWYMQRQTSLDEEYLRKWGYSQDEVFRELDSKVDQIIAQDLLFDLQPFFVSKTYIQDWCHNFHQFYEEYRGFYG